MTLAIVIFILLMCILLAAIAPATALIVSVPAGIASCVIASYLGSYYEEYFVHGWAFVVGLAIVPFTALTVLLRERGRDEERFGWLRKTVNAILLVAGSILILAICLWVFQLLGLIFFAVFVSSIISYKLTTRLTLRANIVSIISTGVRQNLPLTVSLEAAGDERDKSGRILQAISGWLCEGYPLNEAIRRGYPGFPVEYLTTIGLAERIGQLPQAMESIERDIIEKTSQSKKVKPVHPAYLVLVMIITAIMVQGLMIFIIPVYSEVINDMMGEQASLPGPTLFLMNMSRWLMGGNGLNLLLVIAAAVAVIRILSMGRKRRPQKPYIASRMRDFIKWHLPVSGWFERSYSLLRIIEVLRISLNAGQTVDTAIENTLGLDINQRMRKRVGRWLEKVRAGENISDSARRCGMGNTIAWAFDDKVNRGHTPEVLETAEEFYRNNYNYKANIARAVMWPFAILGLGLTIGFVVYAMFMPIVAITQYTLESQFP